MSSSAEVEVSPPPPPPPPPPASESDDRALAAAPPIPIGETAAGFSGSHPVQSLTASCPAALAGLFANQVTLPRSGWFLREKFREGVGKKKGG